MREFRTHVEQTGRKAPDGRSLERITLGFSLKTMSAEGKGTGYLSAFGNEDSYGDVCDPGCYSKTIQDRSADNPLPLLWQHYSDEPIGVYTKLEEDDHGLYTEFQLAMDTQRGREAYALANMKAVKGQSIGFTTIKDVIDGGLRRLKELKLWEGSMVTFPANELATITGVKGADGIIAEIADLRAKIEELESGLLVVKAYNKIGEDAPQSVVDGAKSADPARAAAMALADEIRTALDQEIEPHKNTEPDESTRLAVAELRREMESFLAA